MSKARQLQRKQQARVVKSLGTETSLPELLKKSIASTETLVAANRLLTQENADLRERIKKLDEEVSITLQEHEEKIVALQQGLRALSDLHP